MLPLRCPVPLVFLFTGAIIVTTAIVLDPVRFGLVSLRYLVPLLRLLLLSTAHTFRLHTVPLSICSVFVLLPPFALLLFPLLLPFHLLLSPFLRFLLLPLLAQLSLQPHLRSRSRGCFSLAASPCSLNSSTAVAARTTITGDAPLLE